MSLTSLGSCPGLLPRPPGCSPNSDLVEEAGAAAGGDYDPEAGGLPDVLPIPAVCLDGLDDRLGERFAFKLLSVFQLDTVTKLEGILR